MPEVTLPDDGAAQPAPGGPGLTADTVRQWCGAGLRALARNRAQIDGLNIYPVPDGDTGTNMQLTFEAAARAVDEVFEQAAPAQPEAAEAVRALALGAQLGARGNSGVILAQLLRGAAEVLAPAEGPAVFDAERFGRALRRATDLGYRAVAAPVEGTVLSVVAAAAEAAESAAARAGGSQRGRTVTTVLAAVESAELALLRTPEQLEVLARAGVVDAGGRGLVVLLDALAETAVGRAAGHRSVPSAGASARPGGAPASASAPLDRLDHLGEATPDGPSYEVLYLLDAEEQAVAVLRERLAGLGDSLVVVGGDGLWTVHVHVDDPGAAVEAGVEAGRPHRIRIEHFGAASGGAAREHAPEREVRKGRAVVAVADGAGLTEVFAGAGAIVLAGAGVGADAELGSAEPEATGGAVRAVLDAAAAEAVLLPGSPGRWQQFLDAAAELEASGVRARVVPAESPVQALAALAVHEPTRELDDDTAAMSEAAAATLCAALVQRGTGWAGVIGPDPAAAPAATSDNPTETGCSLLDLLLADGTAELITLLPGAAAPPGLTDTLRAHAQHLLPDAETVVLPGGQPGTALLIGVE